MEFLKEAKNNFIQSEIWMLTFGAAFQRANIYKSNLTKEQIAQKGYFKTMTIGLIESVIVGQYISGEVTDEQHIDNIKSISRYSTNFEEIFQNGGINFGIAQKILNLYLKYKWTLGEIQTPPHFPVDRIIQIKLNEFIKREGLNKISLEAWTQFEDEAHYLKVINLGRELISKSSDFKGYKLAELELELFQRR
jgi:hypothetical protein